MHKLTKLGTIILIGLNAILLTSCPGEKLLPVPNNIYSVTVENKTDSLLLLTRKKIFFNKKDILKCILYPNKTVHYKEILVGVNENENVSDFLNRELSSLDSCWLYTLDTILRKIIVDNILEQYPIIPEKDNLLKVWEGPFSFLEDDNHFFNYSSWDLIQFPIDSIKGIDGTIKFTITDKDLE